jgi:hypothetical protein
MATFQGVPISQLPMLLLLLPPWRYSPNQDLASSMRFQNNTFLRGEVVSPMPNPQPGEPGYPFFVWVMTFDLSDMGDLSGYF